jgi:hypothetical protein
MGNHTDAEIVQINFKTAFLYGDINYDVFIEPLKGINIPDGKTLKLKKSLYSLQTSSRTWFEKLRAKILSLGFKECLAQSCLFLIKKDNFFLYNGYLCR